MTWAILALLIPAMMGALAAHALWPPPNIGARRRLGQTAFLTFLGWPLGWGIAATIYFFCSLLFARPAVPSAAIEIILLASLAFHLGGQRARPSEAPRPPSTLTGAVLLTVFIQICVAALIVSIRAAQAEPLGSWDGWAIWNFHARFIDRAGDDWASLLRSPQVAWSHPDYPILLPANVARLWAWRGHEAPGAAAAVSLLFGVGTVGLLLTALLRRRGPIVALMAAIALASTPFFVTFASNEHADIPLGLFILAVCVLLSDSKGPETGAGPRRLAALTGATIGLAASVKNEGQLFALVAVTAWSFLACRNHSLRSTALSFGLGLLLALAPLLYFKLHLAPPNDLASSHPLGRLGQVFAPGRHHQILSALRRDLPGFGQWRWVPFLPLAAALIGSGWRRLALSEWTLATVLLLTALGYYAVYLLSPFDLQWHLDSSLVRLLMQLWPSALFFWGLAALPQPFPDWIRLPAPPRWLLLSLNAAGALFLLFLFNRQLAPNEFAATRFHAVHAVLAPDWYPAESNGASRWSWSSGSSTLHLVADRGHLVQLRFAARGLRAERLSIRQNGKTVWSAPIDSHLTRFTLPLLTAPSDLVFASDQPGEAESADARSRTLAFALYDLRIE